MYTDPVHAAATCRLKVHQFAVCIRFPVACDIRKQSDSFLIRALEVAG